jgi:putative membrane protein
MKQIVIACSALLAVSPAFAQSSATTPANDASPKAGASSTTGPGTKTTATPNTANPAKPGQPASTVSSKAFVTKAAQSDMFEIQSSQLVDQSGVKDASTKSFAQKMIEDHTKTSNELKQTLRDNKAEQNLPSSMSKSQQKMLNRLKGLRGEALGAQYRRDQLDVHQKAVNLFQAYANTGDNEALKAWAAKTLPALEQHLQMAKQLRNN